MTRLSIAAILSIALLSAPTNAGMRNCDLKHTRLRLPGSVNIVRVGDSIDRVRETLQRNNIGRSVRIDNGSSWTDLYFDSGELDTICREMK